MTRSRLNIQALAAFGAALAYEDFQRDPSVIRPAAFPEAKTSDAGDPEAAARIRAERAARKAANYKKRNPNG